MTGKNSVTHIDLIGTYKLVYPTTILLSSEYSIFAKLGDMLNHKNKHQGILKIFTS